ncbi:short-chain fatty acid transporter [Altibacter sp. HG106]|uniref:short-chain fatty acid transporter n=1 Tax=Altibacter sp. HG106 TaxID=3023937 RepID=UPI002350B49F|nr:TIGR00366 family protein [Altibacter sp. HG106]MDC7995236.1 TIGR00366 family protein [Altibacter sp. HG106]
MKLTRGIEAFFSRFMPSPFAIALLLTVITIILALLFTEAPGTDAHLLTILSYWEQGIWNNALLVFAYQMILILVLGHILVLSAPMNQLIEKITTGVRNTGTAVVLVSVTTMLVAFFNWGLGLIFGAILARKIAESAQKNGFPINYPLVGAAGYGGFMIWHGGISGSAPSKVAESGHLASLMQGIGRSTANSLPSQITYAETVFSTSNLLIFSVVLIAVPLMLYVLGRRLPATPITLPTYEGAGASDADISSTFYDRSRLFGIGIGVLLLVTFAYQYWNDLQALAITPNMLNFFMLGLALILHGSVARFLTALEEAIKGASGILIQFPLYFGIMGIMKDSGMVVMVSEFFVSIATPITLPIVTFFSAGLVNIFVPSGGGQWAVQGPIVIDSAQQLGVPLPKAIMALAYGDQLTNMLQPFWALPLLGITRLKAKEILPYTLLIMLLGGSIFIIGLLIW